VHSSARRSDLAQDWQLFNRTRRPQAVSIDTSEAVTPFSGDRRNVFQHDNATAFFYIFLPRNFPRRIVVKITKHRLILHVTILMFVVYHGINRAFVESNLTRDRRDDFFRSTLIDRSRFERDNVRLSTNR